MNPNHIEQLHTSQLHQLIHHLTGGPEYDRPLPVNTI